MIEEKQTDETLNEFTEQQSSIRSSIKMELHNSVNFLDFLIHLREKELQFAIDRKPTQIYIIIPIDSCYPHEHKISCVSYLVNRLKAYPMSKEAKEKE
jgi:hypothetical protein